MEAPCLLPMQCATGAPLPPCNHRFYAGGAAAQHCRRAPPGFAATRKPRRRRDRPQTGSSSSPGGCQKKHLSVAQAVPLEISTARRATHILWHEHHMACARARMAQRRDNLSSALRRQQAWCAVLRCGRAWRVAAAPGRSVLGRPENPAVTRAGHVGQRIAGCVHTIMVEPAAMPAAPQPELGGASLQLQ